MTGFISAWPLELLVLVYLVSMYFLIKMFIRNFKIIRLHPNNGLEQYRRLVTIAILVTILDATYAMGTRILLWFLPDYNYVLYGLLPMFIKSLILICIWGFYHVQINRPLDWLSLKSWKKLLNK